MSVELVAVLGVLGCVVGFGGVLMTADTWVSTLWVLTSFLPLWSCLLFFLVVLGASLHGASHVDRAFFLSLVHFLVVVGSRLEGPAQLVGVGVDSLPLLDHLFDLSGVHVAMQIEPNVFPVEKNDLGENTFLVVARSVSSPTVSRGGGFRVPMQKVLVPLSGFFVGLVVGSPVPSFVRVSVVVPVARPPSWSRVHRHRRAVHIVLHLVPRPRLASCRPVSGHRSYLPLRPCAGLRCSLPCAASATPRSRLRSLLAFLLVFPSSSLVLAWILLGGSSSFF